jgi:hypothetical protein
MCLLLAIELKEVIKILRFISASKARQLMSRAFFWGENLKMKKEKEIDIL